MSENPTSHTNLIKPEYPKQKETFKTLEMRLIRNTTPDQCLIKSNHN